MPTFKSAAEFFRAAHGKRVVRRQNINTIDQWPERMADIKRQLLEQGCPADQIRESDTALHWPGAFSMKPKVPAVTSGTLTVRSADYIFRADGVDEGWFGDKKGATVEGGLLVKEYPDGRRITFEIGEAA